MKLTVSKSAILDGLQKIQSVVNPRTTLPVLSNVLLQAEKDTLWLTATDLEITVRTAVKAKIEEKGATTLPARRITSIFRELPELEVDFGVDDNDVATLTAGNSFFRIVGISEEEFPALPELSDGDQYTLDQGMFREMLRKTAYAVSVDETRHVLNGVLLSFKGNQLVVVATDGRRLALVEQDVEFPEDAQREPVIPTKTVNELQRTLRDEGALKVQISDKMIAFEFEGMLIVSKLIDGTYPNYKQVIPSESEHRITVEREMLLTAVKRVSLLSRDQSSSVRLVFDKNKLTVTTETPDIGEAREVIPVKYDAGELAVAFNPDFMMDPLRNLESDEVYLELTDELSPGVIKTDVPFLYVIMPIRVG